MSDIPGDFEHCCSSGVTGRPGCSYCHSPDSPAAVSSGQSRSRGTPGTSAARTGEAVADQGRRGTRPRSSGRPAGAEAGRGRLAGWSWPLSQIVATCHWPRRPWRPGPGSAAGWSCAAGRPADWAAAGSCAGSAERPQAARGRGCGRRSARPPHPGQARRSSRSRTCLCKPGQLGGRPAKHWDPSYSAEPAPGTMSLVTIKGSSKDTCSAVKPYWYF